VTNTSAKEVSMRVYIRVPREVVLKLLAEGFSDVHHDHDAGRVGVWCDDRPRGGLRAAPGRGVLVGGPEGDTVLCAEVPEKVFRKWEAQESTRSLTADEFARRQQNPVWGPYGMEYQRMGYAVIPAATLNQHGRPRIYDHDYLGEGDRRDLVQAAEAWESMAEDPDYARKAKELRDAIAFLDQVGWQTPLRLRESAPEDYAKPGPWFNVKRVVEE
jgi:hypothetical protein